METKNQMTGNPAGVSNLATEQPNSENRLKELIYSLISKSESLIQRARAIDKRLLGKNPEVELGEITRLETTIKNVKKEIEEQTKITVRKPVWRQVTDKSTGRVLNMVLKEYCWCGHCLKIQEADFIQETPEEVPHWECHECGNDFLEELNGEGN